MHVCVYTAEEKNKCTIFISFGVIVQGGIWTTQIKKFSILIHKSQLFVVFFIILFEGQGIVFLTMAN